MLFKHLAIIQNVLFDLEIINIVIPVSIQTWHLDNLKSHQFYLCIKNGSTTACYAEPIRTKGQTFDIFQKFICLVECQSGKKLKYLKANFQGKFANEVFKEYTALEGIKW